MKNYLTLGFPKITSFFLLIASILISFNSCRKDVKETNELAQKETATRISPNVLDCGEGYHWDYTLNQCVPNCPSGYIYCPETGNCVPNTIGCYGNGAFNLSEGQSLQVVQSPEFQNVIQKQNQFLDIINSAINRGISFTSIQSAALYALQNSDCTYFYTLLFSSYQTGDAFFNDFTNAKRAFVQANSFIEENPSIFTCTTCQTTIIDEANYFFNNFPSLNAYRYSSETDFSSRVAKPPTCGSWWNQVKLVGCASLCGVTTAGLGAALCGWGCWCTFCTKNSALAAVICAN